MRRQELVRKKGVREDVSWRHAHWPARWVEHFVVSPPKAGRTWLRAMLAAVEAGARGVPAEDVLGEWLQSDAPRLNGTPVLFTHALSSPADQPAWASELFLRYIGDRRRLFLVRDPRDAVVSRFFQVTKRARRSGIPAFSSIGDFVRDPDYGIERFLHFMQFCAESLQEDHGPAMVLSYEELHCDTLGSLRAAARFFSAEPANDDILRSAVELCSFENLHRLEQARSFSGRYARLIPSDLDDPESFKTRKGEVGGYVNYLSADDVAYLEERITALQPSTLGYREPGVPPRLYARESTGSDGTG